MEALTDEELVAQFQSAAGSAGADSWINELFSRYHSKVATWCFRFTGDRESASDLAQDIFLKAYRNLGSFRRDAKFSTWLYSIARNHCINEMKARAVRRVEAAESLTDISDILDAGQESALARLEQKEFSKSVRSLIEGALDEVEMRVMTLHYGQEVALDAITRLLGLTNPSGAKAYIVSARRKLKAAAQRWRVRRG